MRRRTLIAALSLVTILVLLPASVFSEETAVLPNVTREDQFAVSGKAQPTASEEATDAEHAQAHGAQPEEVSATTQDASAEALAQVEDAVSQARAYLDTQEMPTSGFRGAIEHKKPGICVSRLRATGTTCSWTTSILSTTH